MYLSLVPKTALVEPVMAIGPESCCHCDKPVGLRNYYELPPDDDGYRPRIVESHWGEYVAQAIAECGMGDVAGNFLDATFREGER